MEQKKENVPDNVNPKIRESQIIVAQAMKLPTEMIEELQEEALNFQQREWLSIAMKMGMPLNKIREIKGYSVQQIYRELMEFLRIRLSSTDLLKKTVDEELAKVKAVLEENKRLRETLMNNLEASMNQTIQLLQDKVEMLEKDIREKDKKIQSLSTEKRPKQEKSNKTVVPDPEEQEKAEPNVPDRHKLGKVSGLFKFFSGSKEKDFKMIENYIKDPDMSDDQKAFILDAWEEGMSAREISSFANKNLSVDIMKRLKESIQRRKKGC